MSFRHSSVFARVLLVTPALAQPIEDARLAYNQGNFALARETALALSNDGDAAGQNLLGVLYESGLGVEPETPRAIAYYEAAIAQGSDRAMTNLGGLYADGLGVAQDYALARAYYGIAAEGGLARAMEYLAWLTEFGHGGPPDVPLARAWYERAADAGNVASLYALGDILFYGAEGVAVDIPRAMEFYERGHAAGSIDSSYMLGVLYQEGGLLPVDLVYARHLLMQAVQMDVQRAFNELCIMMIDGRGGPDD